jgi:YD repeat-containing protein
MAGMDRDRRWGPGCPLCGETDNSVGGPINTFNGNYTFLRQDLSIPALGQPLRFERSYNAQSSDLYTKPLGYGWTHNYNIRLITSTAQSGGEAGVVILQGWAGGRFRFLKNTDNGVYTPLPGIWATLTRTLTAPYTYTLTTVDQTIYTFNAAGLPVAIRDQRGNLTNLAYTGTQLIRVADATGQRYLNFGYDGQGRVFTLTDPINRIITYTYDINGNLSRITDTRGFTWTYSYTGTNNHLLAEVRGPSAMLVERTEYDSQNRAVRQWTNASSQPLGLQYLNGLDAYGFPTQTVVITDPLGRVTIDNYNARGTLVGQQRTGASTARGYDAAFN